MPWCFLSNLLHSVLQTFLFQAYSMIPWHLGSLIHAASNLKGRVVGFSSDLESSRIGQWSELTAPKWILNLNLYITLILSHLIHIR